MATELHFHFVLPGPLPLPTRLLLPLAGIALSLPYEIQIHDDGRQVALHVSNSVRGSFRSQHWTQQGKREEGEGGGGWPAGVCGVTRSGIK